MKKGLAFFASLCAVCSALGAQVFYEGQGGENIDIRVSEIVPRGERLSSDEAVLLPGIQSTLGADFKKYAGMTVVAPQGGQVIAAYTVSGTITKRTDGAFILELTILDRAGIIKTVFPPALCTLSGYQIFQVIKDASETLITGMGVTLTGAGRNALRAEKEEWKRLANADSPTQWGTQVYSYQPVGLDPQMVENARRLSMVQVERYKAPEFNFVMPRITAPGISVPQFKAPEIRIEVNPNIGDNARKQQADYDAQREASRQRQESGNSAMKKMQDDFLVQFKAQADAVKKQQADLMGQRDILLGQQRTLLERQRYIIAQLRETENSYDAFFTEHPPIEIIYDPKATQTGIQDLEKKTINLQFTISSVGTTGMQVIPLMLADFEKGLGTIAQGLKDINAEFDKIQSLLAEVEEMGRNALAQLVRDYAAQMANVQAAEADYAAQLENMDTVLKTTGYARMGRDFALRPDSGYAERLAGEYAVQPSRYNAAGDRTLGSAWTLAKWNRDETRTFAIEARLENDAGKTIGTAAVTLTNRTPATEYTQPMSDSASCVFRNVPVNDLTDTLKVLIQRVNGRNVTAAANSGYIKISPLEADGYTKDGWDLAGYGKDGYNCYGYTTDGYDRLGYNKAGYDRGGYDRLGYNKYGYDRAGYNKNGYDSGGYDKNGRNARGQTRQDVERERRKAAREARIHELWGGYYAGFFIGGAFNLQPTGGLGEFGVEGGGRYLVFDFGLSWGGGSLKLTDELVEEKLGPMRYYWQGPVVFTPRIGVAFPLNFTMARLNIGGGIEFLNIFVDEYKGKKTNEEGKVVNSYSARMVDSLFTPYVGARLDIPFTQYGGLLGFIGYRAEFTPADKVATYFGGEPSSLRHTIFAGLLARLRWRQ